MVEEEGGEEEGVVCQRRHQDKQWRKKRAKAERGSKREVRGKGAHVLMGQRWYRGAGVQGVLCYGLLRLLCPRRKMERAMRGWELGYCQHQVRVLAGSQIQVWVRRCARGGEEEGAEKMRRRLRRRRERLWAGGWEA